MNMVSGFIQWPYCALRRRTLMLGLAIVFGVAASAPVHATSFVPFFKMLFEGDDATLNETQKAQLDQLIVREDFRGKKLVITGRYDRAGSPEHRVEMSRRLAEAVRDYLVAVGVPPDTLTLYWLGDRPLAERSVSIHPRCC